MNLALTGPDAAQMFMYYGPAALVGVAALITMGVLAGFPLGMIIVEPMAVLSPLFRRNLPHLDSNKQPTLALTQSTIAPALVDSQYGGYYEP